MTKATLALSEAMAQTFTIAEKNALTRRASDLRFHLSFDHSDLHPLVQVLSTAYTFNSYAMKYAVLKLWDEADDKQKAQWVRSAEHSLGCVLWHERHTPGYSAMIQRILTGQKGFHDFIAAMTGAFAGIDFTVDETPLRVTHRPRPDYLQVVDAQAGDD